MSEGNPFYYNLPARPADFLGRWALAEEIVGDLRRLTNSDSWALIGGRRFGKSSLLLAIHHRLSERLWQGPENECTVFPFLVDLKRCHAKTERHIYKCLVHEIYRALIRHPRVGDISRLLITESVGSEIEELQFYRLEDVLDELVTHLSKYCRLPRLCLLLDEVEFTAHFDWSEHLFNQLRALIYSGSLSDSVKIVLTGSQRVIQVRQGGSPLLNAIKISHLEVFTNDDIRQLIARGGVIAEDTCKRIELVSGGHPFVAQYLLHHLWNAGLANADPSEVEAVGRRMRQERAADLQGWWDAIGESGRRFYAQLATSNDWQDEANLVAQVGEPSVTQGLASLCFHGIAAHDESRRYYRAMGQLFRDWYSQNVMKNVDSKSANVSHLKADQSITWLHLSDLHFKQTDQYNENVVLSSLLKDVARRIAKDNLAPDVIAVTGDIAFSGRTAEYELAQAFFTELLKITSLTRERLLIVPGNHDVDRALISAGAVAIGASLTDSDRVTTVLNSLDDRRLLLSRFKGYSDFVNEFFAGHIVFDENHYHYVQSFEIGGRTVAFLGLNSAWLAGSEDDKSSGVVIGGKQVRSILGSKDSENAGLRIALVHHPTEWLREFDQLESTLLLQDNCDFILHGHLHRPAMLLLSGPDSGAMVVAGGACYETRQYPNSYNFVRLDFANGTGSVHLLRYTDERGGFWARDTLLYRNVPDGVYEFVLPAKISNPPS